MGKPYLTSRSIKYLTCTVLLSLLAVTTQAQKELYIGQRTTTYNLNKDGHEYFKLKINMDNFSGSEDLVIKVVEGDISSDPDVYISKSNERPTNKDNSQWACSSYGKDTCSINRENINIGDTFFVGVHCAQKCSFQVFPQMAKEIELEDGEEVQMDFAEQESKIFKIRIPPNSAKDEENRINSIVITAAPYLPGVQDVTLAVSSKAKVTPSTNTLKGVPAWNKGQALRLSEGGKEFCTGCTVTILVDVVEAGRYGVSAKTNVGIPKLYSGKKIDDVAYFGDEVCYSYYVKDAKSDLQVRTTQYSGMVSLYVNQGEIAKPLNESQYSMAGHQSSLMTISAKERSRVKSGKNKEAGTYYICLFPHLTSTYSVIVSEVDADADYQVLEDGFVENGEVKGKQIAVYAYKVPPLSYVNEDINLNFQLQTVSGEVPILAVAFCDDEDVARCAEGISRSYVMDRNTDYQKAIGNNNLLTLEYEHSESDCAKYKNGCYYTVVVVGNNDDDKNLTKFELQVTHSQQSFIILPEMSQVSDYIHTGAYKYYKFTLVDSEDVKNVTIIMTTLHGDADLFISRKDQFPTRQRYEKSSQKSYGITDFVFFDQKPIQNTYYIGVHGYQYSTFTLQIKVDRGQDNNFGMQLLEGIPTRGYMSDKFGHDNYRFEVKMSEGYEKAIKVQTSAFEGRVKTYVKFGSPANKDDFHYETEDSLIVIKPDNYHYQREGTYYVAIYPHFSFWELFQQTNYGYMISFTSEQQFSYLQSNHPLEVSQEGASSQFFRHFIQDLTDDIKLSLTTISGSPQVYIGLSPNKKWPSKTNQDQQFVGSSISQGKTFVYTKNQLKSTNPACANDNQVGEACAIYVGVTCESDCKYTLKASYADSLPHQLTFGMPQHDSVDTEDYNYYYLNVKKDKQKDIYAVLSTISGNADIFVSFEPSPATNDIRQWEKPTIKKSDMQSTETLAQDVIRIKPADLEKCFKTKGNEDEECSIVIAVFGAQAKGEKVTLSRYNLVVYADVAILLNNAPLSNQVEEGQYHYYIYQAHCSNCTIIVSLSTFGTGDPDLFIGIGDSRLPTKDDHDIGSASLKSEAIEIDLKTKYFADKKLKTLKGTYIIAVYGSKNSTYTLSVTQEENSFVLIQDGLAVKRRQSEYDEAYFKWYNWEEKDVKVSLDVKNGLADLYMSVFDSNDVTQNFVERIPNNKKQTKWRLENIKPSSNYAERSHLISKGELNFCTDCYFLIGVVTHEMDTEYNLQIDKVDANFKSDRFIRIAEPNTDRLNKGHSKTYKFVVDEKSKVRASLQLKTGQIKWRLGFNDVEKDSFFSAEGSNIFTVDTDNANFQAGKMYYLNVLNKGDEAAEYTILITTDRSIVSLPDGIPTSIKFEGMQDMSKTFTFKVPEGDSVIRIQVKAKTEKFYPKMYYAYFEDLDDKIQTMQFPPGATGFFEIHSWDYSLGLLTVQREFKNVKGNKAGFAIVLFDNSNVKQYHQYVETIITASSSGILGLIEDSWTSGQITKEGSFIIYKFEIPNWRPMTRVVVEFAECYSNSSAQILTDPDLAKNQRILPNREWINGKEVITYVPNKETTYIQVIGGRTGNPLWEFYYGADFVIKATAITQVTSSKNQYKLGDDGELDYTMLTPSKMNLTWGDVKYKQSSDSVFRPMKPSTIIYFIVETDNMRAKLDSVCMLMLGSMERYNLKKYELPEQSYVLPVRTDRSYQFNVLAQVRNPKDASFNRDGDIIPFKPVQIHLESKSYALFKAVIFWLFVILAIGTVIKLWYSRKGENNFYVPKQPNQRIEYEMTNVRNTTQDSSYMAPDEFKSLV